MLTRCPNPNCKFEFDIPADREGKNGPCPSCGQVITYRSLAVLREIERQHERLKSKAPGAPMISPGPVALRGLLEDVRSLWNVGSIFRTADGAGFSALYLCGITGCPPHKSIAKTSLGAEEHVAWSHHTSALEILPELSASGVQIVALETGPGSIPLRDALGGGMLHTPLCLMVGNEVAGLSAEASQRADLICHLPMRGIKSSLNVAVAFGIAAYAIGEQRQES
jgi:tRNA G18 (ribose-2'-O)-methylase SpoU